MSAFTDFIGELFAGNGKKKEEYNAARQELEDYVKENTPSVLPERPKLPDTPSYDRMEYEGKSDEELKSQAEKELADYYNAGKNSVQSETESLRKKYDADKLSAEKSAAAKNESVEAAYNTAKERTDNDVLKRGLARSSIAALSGSELSKEAAKQTSAIATALADTLSSIDGEIENLSVKKEKALNDFNIAYASKLAARINDLSSERDKKIAEAIKYNNTLAEKEYTANVNKQIKESDLYGEALKQKETENALKENEKISGDYGAIYAKMRDALSKLGASDAREAFIYDPIYRDNLSDYYYYKLYDEFGRR